MSFEFLRCLGIIELRVKRRYGVPRNLDSDLNCQIANKFLLFLY